MPEPAQQARFMRYGPFGRCLIGLSLALLITLLFFSPVVKAALTTSIIAIGLDPLTTDLICALLLITAAAIASAMLSRQRLGTAIGAGIAYGFSYILPFIYQEQLPLYDPAGHIETFNASNLPHTIIVLMAAGVLCAYIGAILGSGLGEVLLDPIWQLGQLVWQTYVRSKWARKQSIVGDKGHTRNKWGLLFAWIGLVTLLGLFLLSSGISELLFYSPDLGLHNPPAVATRGTLITDSMVSPALQGQRRSFLIYLPPSYQNAADQERRYPTLYLLHGSPGSEYDWISGGKAVQSADTLIGQGKIPELIMVFPDGNGRNGETSEWGNSFDQQQLMENFVTVDLVHFIDQKYRTIPTPGYRAIGGFSMGGFGATNIAIHHPDIFGSVISLAGYYTADGSIWGQNKAYLQANSPVSTLPASPQAWKLRIFLGAGTKDQPYYSETQNFSQELKALHMDYTVDLEDGYHTWSVWETQLYHGLNWLRWK
jgi:enterochelin esterase-like enzyme